MTRKVVALFAKVPIQGAVKTRLERGLTLSSTEILSLHEAFLADTITTALASSADMVLFDHYPAEALLSARDFVDRLDLSPSDRARILFRAQRGSDEASRIENSLKFDSDGRVLIALIGSDAPLMDSTLLDRTFEFLDRSDGLVLGPSGGTGVYLIGARSRRAIDFGGKIFDGRSEFENLIDHAIENRLDLLTLPICLDVDLPEDLLALSSAVKARSYEATRGLKRYIPARSAEWLNRFDISVELDERDNRQTRVTVTERKAISR